MNSDKCAAEYPIPVYLPNCILLTEVLHVPDLVSEIIEAAFILKSKAIPELKEADMTCNVLFM